MGKKEKKERQKEKKRAKPSYQSHAFIQKHFNLRAHLHHFSGN